MEQLILAAPLAPVACTLTTPITVLTKATMIMATDDAAAAQATSARKACQRRLGLRRRTCSFEHPESH